MAKVLFVVYVPLSIPEENVGDTGDEEKTVPKVDNTIEEKEKESDSNADVEIESDENNLEDGNTVEKITSDSGNGQDKVTDTKTEEEITAQIDDPSKNVFFSNEERKEEGCGETVSAVEAEDSESCSKEKDNQSIDSSEEREKPAFVRFVSELSLVEKVKRVLDDINVSGVQWNQTEQNIHIGMFVADYGSQCEEILRKLSMLQIGVIKDSSVSVFPASISSEEKWVKEEFEEAKIREDELSERVSKFKDSIKSRLVVDQVVNAVKNDAMFTFDYLMLVILASFVALMGLLESSSVVLVASMLISPLMGPILAGVFGVVIRKEELIRVGIVNEMKGLTFCVLIGLIIGFIPASLEAGTADWRSSTEWPTPEMSSRGALRALPVGILIAVPSGAGVALSILGGKVGSLVGVAISASLLPPAVNAGLLWANAIVSGISSPLVVSNVTTDVDRYYSAGGLTCESLYDNDYQRQYYCSMAKESVVLGCVSLLLTILNIICIIFMGVIVLKIKEVAPIPQSFIPESETEFFCQDLRIARESNVTMKGQAAAAIRKDWLKTYQDMKSQCGKDDDEEEEDENELNNIIEEVEGSPSVMNIYDKMHIRPPRWSHKLNLPSSYNDEGKKFDFPTPSPREDTENGIELRRRTPLSLPQTPKTGQEEEHEKEKNAVYFTVHRYIDPRDLLKGDSYSHKSGKFIKTLKVPKTSRFMIARVEEDPAENIKPLTSQPHAVGEDSQLETICEISDMEAQPLINSQTSNIPV